MSWGMWVGTECHYRAETGLGFTLSSQGSISWDIYRQSYSGKSAGAAVCGGEARPGCNPALAA